jgi:hypothetical protein
MKDAFLAPKERKENSSRSQCAAKSVLQSFRQAAGEDE